MSDDSSSQSGAPLSPNNGMFGQSGLLAPIGIVATVVIFYAAQLIGALALSFYAGLHHWSRHYTDDWLTNSVAAQFAYGLMADGLILLGVSWMLQMFGWRWATIGLRMPRKRHLLYGLLAAVPYYVLYVTIVLLVSWLVPSFDINQKQDIGFNSVAGPVALVLTFISLVILPPLAEEIVTRGFLYTALRTWLPKVLAALVVSGLFGAAHLAEGGAAGPLWVGALDTFILSVVLVFLREKTGNLWAGITLHAVKNSVAFVTLFILHAR